MNTNNYTTKALQAIQDAQNLALTSDNTTIDIPHLLLSLVEQKDGYVPQIIKQL